MFDFSTVSLEDIKNQLENLHSSKKGTFNPTMNVLLQVSTYNGPNCVLSSIFGSLSWICLKFYRKCFFFRVEKY